jgi:hypothetical protein
MMQNPPEFSDTYIRALLKKHEIVMRTPIMIEAVSYSVEKLSNLMIVSSILHESEIKTFYEQYRIARRHQPFDDNFVFNVDETMITVEKNKRKVACINKETKPIAIIPPKMEHLTLLLGGSAGMKIIWMLLLI